MLCEFVYLCYDVMGYIIVFKKTVKIRMTKFTFEQKKFIIATFYQLNNQRNNNNAPLNQVVPQLFNKQYPNSSFTFKQLNDVYKNRPKVKVNLYK